MPAPTAPEIAMTFTLEHPQTVKSMLYNELNARRPKVKDLRVLAMGSDKDPVGSYNKFLAGICTVPPEVIDELDLADYNTVRDWVSGFLPKSDDATSS